MRRGTRRTWSCILPAVGILLAARANFGADEPQIRVMTAWKHEILGGVVQPADTRVSSTTFDREGRLHTQTIYDQDDSALTTSVATYDDNDRLRQLLVTSSLVDYGQRHDYIYIGDQLAEVVVYANDGSVTHTSAATYSDAGQLTEIVTQSADGAYYVRIANRYDTTGNLVGSSSYDKAGRVLVEKNYLDNTLIFSPGNESLMSGLPATSDHTFNNDGTIAEETSFDENGNVLSRTSCTYDAENRPTEIQVEMPASGLSSRVRLVYDERGNIAEKITYNKLDEPVLAVRMEYEYYGQDEPAQRHQGGE